ncbi:HtaA domain-containing protein [Arthrobacter sp. GCM10027362]|uniref:HtaA domain-containing protein n=1 Tax=Arthrobacter sp. GCM10027362 TaxID=3273379 RepID=UPI00362E16F7
MDSAPEPTAQQPAGGDSSPAGLTWGIKRSFINYISRLPDGSVTAQDGAAIVDGSFFRFESDGGEHGSLRTAGVLRFRGQVQLRGHYGMLSVLIADPWIEFDNGAAVVSIVDVRHWPDRSKRVPLLQLPSARLVADGACHFLPETPARLTSEGSVMFNEQYQPGEKMDPVAVVLQGPDSRCPTG